MMSSVEIAAEKDAESQQGGRHAYYAHESDEDAFFEKTDSWSASRDDPVDDMPDAVECHEKSLWHAEAKESKHVYAYPCLMLCKHVVALDDSEGGCC